MKVYLNSEDDNGVVKVKENLSLYLAPSFRLGVQAMIQNVGLGKLRPNIMVIGFKDDWITASNESIEEYSDVIHDAFDLNYGFAILRLPRGTHLEEESDADCSDEEDLDARESSSKVSKPSSVKIDVETDTEAEMETPSATPMILRDTKQKFGKEEGEESNRPQSSRKQREQIMAPLTEKRKGL